MANGIYELARQKFLSHVVTPTTTTGGSISWLLDTIKVTLIDTSQYTVNLTTHEFMDTTTVPTAARIGTDVTLASKTAALGIADAADATFTGVGPNGTTVEALIIWKDTGTPATSPLIAYLDTAAGLPITVTGGNVNIVWDNTGNRIFKL